jgi:hypothetical protein
MIIKLSIIAGTLALSSITSNAQAYQNTDELELNLIHILSNSQDSIRLIGFTDIAVDNLNARKYVKYMAKMFYKITQIKKNTYVRHCIFFDTAGKYIRLYFPLDGAVVDYHGCKAVADHKGLIKNNNTQLQHLKLAAGRMENINNINRKKMYKQHLKQLNGNNDSQDNTFGEVVVFGNMKNVHHTITQHGNAAFFQFDKHQDKKNVSTW